MKINRLIDGKPRLKRVNDDQIMQDLENLIKRCQPKLKGEYDPYCFYESEEKEVYALVYSFYLQKDGVTYEEMSFLTENEGKYLHTELKKSGIKLDYLFIVPYYDYIDRKQGSIMTGAVVTKYFNL